MDLESAEAEAVDGGEDMSSADLVQRKGFGSALWAPM
jgi:hypothetical protein